MSYRIGVANFNPASDSLEVIIGRPIMDGNTIVGYQYITEISTGSTKLETHPEYEQAPTIRIPNEIAHGLLDALTQHYGGSTSVRQLRSDYDHERKRVDKLIDAVINRV